MQQLKIGNSNVVELQRLRNTVTGQPITDANVDMTVYDGAGVAVGGQVWSTSLQHVADGTYRVILDATLELRRGDTYYGIITALGVGGGEEGKWELQLKADSRDVF